MIATPKLELPADHEELLEGAAELHPGHDIVRHASDAVVMQHPTTKQFLHVPHDRIRQHQGRLSKTTTQAGLAQENVELRDRLSRLEKLFEGLTSPAGA